MDVSTTAIQEAKERRNSPEFQFVSCDIETYIPPERHYNVIAFKDSIYYVPFYRLKKVLGRYRGYLYDDGVFIVRIADGRRYENIVKLIESSFHVLENFRYPGSAIVFMVFK